MKKIGIIGGLGPEPTIEYYKIITSRFRKSPTGYPRIIIYSMDVDELADRFESEDWAAIHGLLREGIDAIHRAGADFGLIAANTPHIVFDDIAGDAPIPLLSIVTATLDAVRDRGLSKVGLLGTKFTMRSDLFQKELVPAGVEVVVPGREDQEYIQHKIYNEMTVGTFTDDTRAGLLGIIEKLKMESAIEGVILGCTELPIILDREEFGLHFFDTTRIHAERAIAYCLE
jgi:aspartate racemase